MSQHYALRHWQNVKDTIAALLDLVSDAQLDQQLLDGMPTIGEIARKIVSVEEGMLNLLQRQDEPFPAYSAEDLPTVVSILEKMEDAHLETDAYYKTLTHDGYVTPVAITERGENWVPRVVLYNLLDHDLHHRGQLALLIRLLGIEPPEMAVEGRN